MAQSLLKQKRRVSTQEQIFKILFESDELTWKRLIFSLIEAEEMDPWDIDISLMAKKFLEMLKTLKNLDFRISGKIVLASAILLKMKSSKLVEEEIVALDTLINSADEPLDLFDDLPIDGSLLIGDESKPTKPRLVPRSPQPRKRKVSVYDLVEALEQALEIDARRIRSVPKLIKEAILPENSVDMSTLIQSVYGQVNSHYKGGGDLLKFEDLLPEGAQKEEKVLTFIPLLHLDFQRKVDLLQKVSFGQINVALLQPDATFTQVDLSMK